jgi:maltooligosyltrehalose trehalohydrolase
MRRRHVLPFGAEITQDGVRFRLWAPDAAEVAVALADGRDLPMVPESDGWFGLTTALAAAGTRYRYRIGGRLYPDPAARSQPAGVFADSEVFDACAYDWADDGWPGIPWERALIYEVHVGAFSETGDFAGMAAHLDDLAALGVTLIEVMPVAECPGRWNWGYDGVLPFAPAARYGGPTALKRLIDACHGRGIGVILDVVQNHFGPAGNYLSDYAGAFFTGKHKTAWGAAINFDGAGSGQVRRFFIEHALYWLEEYHLDGLRFDAVHAIIDTGPVHFLTELGASIRRHVPNRPIHLILENDRNDPGLLGRNRGGPGPYDAQWNDDFHHALRVTTTGIRGGYYDDYRDDPVGRLGRALAEGFIYQGESSEFRGGQPRGAPSAGLPPGAFVNFIQNHDQIGNHAYGWRPTKFAEPAALRAAAALLLLAPATPMLFMGEEWASAVPFPFFCDFEGDLAEAVRRGRLAEFAGFAEFRDDAARARIPDPLAEATFLGAKLDWSNASGPGHAEMMALYRHLAALRRRFIVPLLEAGGNSNGRFERFGAGGLSVSWHLAGYELRFHANLSNRPIAGPGPGASGTIYRSHRAAVALPPWFVAVTLVPAAGR